MSFYEPYFPILIFMALAFGLSVLLLIIAYIRSKRNAYHDKDAPYECGFDAFDAPLTNARRRFEIHFYLVAILFIIFDLEIALLFPWAATFQQLGLFGFISMMMFLFTLSVGFVYEWRKGALDWE